MVFPVAIEPLTNRGTGLQKQKNCTKINVGVDLFLAPQTKRVISFNFSFLLDFYSMCERQGNQQKEQLTRKRKYIYDSSFVLYKGEKSIYHSKNCQKYQNSYFSFAKLSILLSLSNVSTGPFQAFVYKNSAKQCHH